MRACAKQALWGSAVLLSCIAASGCKSESPTGTDSSDPSIAYVVVNPNAATVVVNDSLELTANIVDKSGKSLNGCGVTWSNSDPDVVHMRAFGLKVFVTGLSEGTADVSASCKGHTGDAKITVREDQTPVASLVIEPDSLLLGLSETAHLTALTRDSVDNYLPGRKVIWSSTDTSVAGVDSSGLVSPKAYGSVSIVAYSEDRADTAWVDIVPLSLTTLAAGNGHVCSVNVTGYAYCWGSNDAFQTGTRRSETCDDGSERCTILPSLVQASAKFVLVTAGDRRSCGLTHDGKVYCWGSGADTARLVTSELVFSDLSAGDTHVCGLATSGEIYCWGDNQYGQLGNGSRSSASQPVRISSAENFVAVDAGGDFTCAVAVTGKAYCWGYNYYGNLGNGTSSGEQGTETVIVSTVPAQVASDSTFVSVSAGGFHACAITAGQAAYCWGRNRSGQVGTDRSYVESSPVRVVGGYSWTDISAGRYHTCGIASDHLLYCWGSNAYYQDAVRPGLLGFLSWVPYPVDMGILFDLIASGGSHTCGISTDGLAYCWGNNAFGQLGVGSPFQYPLVALPWPVRGQNE